MPSSKSSVKSNPSAQEASTTGPQVSSTSEEHASDSMAIFEILFPFFPVTFGVLCVGKLRYQTSD